MAKADPSPIVRLYLASAVQRLPFSERWSILEGLALSCGRRRDNNLPRMYWFALEPMVPLHRRQSLRTGRWLVKSRRYRNSVARDVWLTGIRTPNELQPGADPGDGVGQHHPNGGDGISSTELWERVALSSHEAFRNQMAVQTHPHDRNTPCVLHDQSSGRS